MLSDRGIYLAIAIWAVTTAALIVLAVMDTSAAPAGPASDCAAVVRDGGAT